MTYTAEAAGIPFSRLRSWLKGTRFSDAAAMSALERLGLDSSWVPGYTLLDWFAAQFLGFETSLAIAKKLKHSSLLLQGPSLAIVLAHAQVVFLRAGIRCDIAIDSDGQGWLHFRTASLATPTEGIALQLVGDQFLYKTFAASGNQRLFRHDWQPFSFSAVTDLIVRLRNPVKHESL